MFYEEILEDDSYDYELIEEMFNPRKKIKIGIDLNKAASRSNTGGAS